MPKLDERVRKLVAEEVQDMHALFLDVDQKNPEQGSQIPAGYGLEGVKAELAKVENMISQIYAKQVMQPDEEEEKSEEEKRKVKELVARILQTSEDDDSTLTDALTEVLNALKQWNPDIVINAPFSGADVPDAGDVAVTAAIKALPIDPRIKALALLMFGVGGKIFRKYDNFLRDATLAQTLIDLDRTKKQLKDMLLKLENEVNQGRAEMSRETRRLKDDISNIKPPEALTNNSFQTTSMLQVVLADLSDLRRLL